MQLRISIKGQACPSVGPSVSSSVSPNIMSKKITASEGLEITHDTNDNNDEKKQPQKEVTTN